MDLVEQVLDPDIPAPVLAPEVFDGRIEVPSDPHPLPASLILKMDGEMASFKMFCNEATEDNPGTACLSGQNELDGMALRLVCPLVNVKCLSPASSNHQLRCVVKDDNIEIIEGDSMELTLIDMDRSVSQASLMGAELSVRNMALADNLTVAILKNKSLHPPSLLTFRSFRHDHPPFPMKV